MDREKSRSAALGEVRSKSALKSLKSFSFMGKMGLEGNQQNGDLEHKSHGPRACQCATPPHSKCQVFDRMHFLSWIPKASLSGCPSSPHCGSLPSEDSPVDLVHRLGFLLTAPMPSLEEVALP